MNSRSRLNGNRSSNQSQIIAGKPNSGFRRTGLTVPGWLLRLAHAVQTREIPAFIRLLKSPASSAICIRRNILDVIVA